MRTLNRSRLRADKPPLLSWREVRLAVDAGLVATARNQAATGKMPYHHVRAFMRLKRGRVEIVRPHWRGNRRFGEIVHRYVAMRAEDEAGPWKGGPLPFPQRID